MGIAYPGDVKKLGAELRALRGIEAGWEWMNKVSSPGPTYFEDYINAEFDPTVTVQNIARKASFTGLDTRVTPQLSTIHGNRKSDFETYFLAGYLGQVGLAAPEDVQAGAVGYDYDAVLAALGEIRITRKIGYLGLLARDMVANAQTIKQNAVSLGSLVPDGGNQGSVVLSGTPAGSDHTLAGSLVITCTEDTVDRPTFSLALELTVPLIDGTEVRGADRSITLAKYYEDGQTGLSNLTLILNTLSITGDGGSIFSSVVVTKPGEADSAKGKFFIQVTRMSGSGGNPDFRVFLYRSGTRGATDLVTSVDIIGTSGTTPITLLGSTTTITATFSKTNAAAALPSPGNTDNDIVFDVRTPRNGDVFRIAVTNNEAGNYASKIGRRWPISLPSVGGGGETISDATAASVAMT